MSFSEENFYNLRSRKVVIATPKLHNKMRKRKRKSVRENDPIFVEDPDSGFGNDFNSHHADEDDLLGRYIPANDWKRVLNSVEKKRDEGLFIECCNLMCKKYRYCDKYHDPVDVPEFWFCSDLGRDVTCATPEEVLPPEIEEQCIENIYTAGSLVWARWPGYPWWPAMVCDSPDRMSFYLLKPPSLKPIRYHVVYLSNLGNIERSWLTVRCLKPFAKTSRNSLRKRMVYRDHDFTEEVNQAYEIATSILNNGLTITERLARYSFLSYFGGYSPSTVASLKSFRSVTQIQPDDVPNADNTPDSVLSEEDAISGTPQKSTKVEKYYKKLKRRRLFK